MSMMQQLLFSYSCDETVTLLLLLLSVRSSYLVSKVKFKNLVTEIPQVL